MTPERQKFNNIILPHFADTYVKGSGVVVDIGKPSKVS